MFSFALLGASFIISGLALYIVHFADGKPVDSWPISPSVYLSILATMSGIALRSAFQEGAETYWWSLLLSESGVKLRTLHSVWELKHDALSRFKITRADPEPILRTAGIILLLMAANGPLLQRAVVVDLVSKETTFDADMPFRKEPMWNLTAKFYYGIITSPAAYQDEFADVAAGLHQRRPIRLPSPICPSDATCETTITVAGFSRACAKEQISTAAEPVLILPDFKDFASGGKSPNCTEVKGSVLSLCQLFSVDFQLEAKFLSRVNGGGRDENVATSPGPDELPWLAPDLFPMAMNYTNYSREDSKSDMITIQRCNFTTAFVDIPIEVTERDVVRMKQLTGKALLLRNQGIESIPSPLDYEEPLHLKMLIGIEQILQDLYAGYSIYDGAEYSHVIQGTGPRQFINQADIRPIIDQRGPNIFHRGFNLSFHDPLESFTETLHELSLRYALANITSTPARLEEMDKYFSNGTINTPAIHDRRERALQAMNITPDKRQQVTAKQTSMVPVYQTNSQFAFIAVGLSTILSVLVALLLTGWRRCGRLFSISPLEIAKAFDAPLLRQVGSNTPASQIAKDDDGSMVRYGEVKQRRGDSASNSDTEPCGALDPDFETTPRAEGDSLMEPTGARLTIDLTDRVVPPVKGMVYV
ncbi:hypothetical protein F5X68DRAFT_229175 [Plectosphaerella plurivora]|uniref:Uncharacterized protein n=1 Tax=Plectosphaerella plurivora TaxID=936078 RepID=A0A9P8VGN6_9PEZI|nr:hypothetical protein F5X68DRAFT_229175 [Plectosphaerella plurivora]